MRRSIAALLAAALLSVVAAGSAAAQPPAQPPVNIGQGLVNVQIGDVTILAPISLAVNLCDVNAAVLVGQFIDDGEATCEATAESIASPGASGNGGNVNIGQGLVNVQIGDITILAPISVAANICDVNVAILVGQFIDGGDATCEATAESIASPGNGGGGGGGGG